MSADAIMGTFVNIKTMADGTPRLVLDLQCSLTEVAAMGLIPGVPFAIARLAKESASMPVARPQEPKEKPGQLCVMACTFCADPMFRDWLGAGSEQDAKHVLLSELRISSRRELDTNQEAGRRFLSEYRNAFLAWKESR